MKLRVKMDQDTSEKRKHFRKEETLVFHRERKGEIKERWIDYNLGQMCQRKRRICKEGCSYNESS